MKELILKCPRHRSVFPDIKYMRQFVFELLLQDAKKMLFSLNFHVQNNTRSTFKVYFCPLQLTILKKPITSKRPKFATAEHVTENQRPYQICNNKSESGPIGVGKLIPGHRYQGQFVKFGNPSVPTFGSNITKAIEFNRNLNIFQKITRNIFYLNLMISNIERQAVRTKFIRLQSDIMFARYIISPKHKKN